MSDKPKYPKALVDPAFDVDTYRKDIVKTLATEIFTIIHREQKVHGEHFGSAVKMNLLASMISTMVYNTLKGGAQSAEGESAYEATCEALAETKAIIETAVGEGFAGGFQAFNPSTTPEYQCDIVCIDAGFDDGSHN